MAGTLTTSTNIELLGRAVPPHLTTTFTPSTFCHIDTYRFNYTEISCHDNNGPLTCSFLHLGPISSTSACFPPGWQPEAGLYFLPGICPDGYTTACSNVVDRGSSVLETQATCCPTGYGFTCQTKTNFPWYATDLCSMVDTGSGVYVYTTSTPGLGPIVSTTTGAYGLNAYGVEIRWRSTDFASNIPSTSSSSSSSFLKATTTTSGIRSSETSSPTTATLSTISGTAISGLAASTTHQGGEDANGIYSDGMIQSARIGVGVGVGIGGFLLVITLVYLLLHHRRKLQLKIGDDLHELSAHREPA